MIHNFLRNRKVVLILTLFIVSVVLGVDPPEECFVNAVDLINDRGAQLEVVTDKTSVS